MVEIKQIGVVVNEIEKSIDPFKFKDVISKIIIDKEFEEGLYNLDKNEYIRIIYYFHKSPMPKKLIGISYFGSKEGVFATRSPIRPGAVGLSTAKIVKIWKNEITVKGLDAINGTPVLDIKPYVPSLDEAEIHRIKDKIYYNNPKRQLWPLIRNWELELILHDAAKFHGHYCAGLAMGIMMGCYAMKKLGAFDISDGMENVIAIVEMNHCATDGIQYVTGCTFGNNAMIFRDLGKTAFSLLKREENSCRGIRISQKPLPWDTLTENLPELNELFEKVVKNRKGTPKDLERLKELMRLNSIKLIKRKFNDLFDVQNISIPPQPWAPIEENVKCEKCGELTMESRTITKNGKILCLECSNTSFYEVSGNGIQKIDWHLE
ncbi:MAG: TrmO family methyltransferase domain-containing protein [Candidatus Helarchaeota archaeon]